MSTVDDVPAEHEHEISNPVEECKKVGCSAVVLSADSTSARAVNLGSRDAGTRVCACAKEVSTVFFAVLTA